MWKKNGSCESEKSGLKKPLCWARKVWRREKFPPGVKNLFPRNMKAKFCARKRPLNRPILKEKRN